MVATLNRNDEQQVRALTHKAIKSALHDALWSPLTLGEKHDIRIKPKFETACWSYLPPHRIYIGTGIVGKAKETLTSVQLDGYVKSHVRHELAHAHWTERKMSKVILALKEINAPFQLFNLFEDARIEDRYRREGEFMFEWLVYEDLAYSTRPESMLFGLIQAEGDFARVLAFYNDVDIQAERQKELDTLQTALEGAENPLQALALGARLENLAMGPPAPVSLERGFALATLERVHLYYERLVAAVDTAGTYPVLTDWMEEFGKPESAPSRGCAGPGDKSDLQLGFELADDAKAREEFELDTEEVTAGKDGDPDSGKKGKAKPKADGALASKGTVLHTQSTMPDLARARKLAERFKKFFEDEARTVSTTTPQRKVSARHFAVGRPYYRVKQLQGKALKKIVLQVDCSGSMSGFHMQEGKILLAALSRLAKQGYISGHVLLSAGAPSRWELYDLPMADEIIARVQAYAGAEGLEPTLKENLTLLREADYVFVYTDAQIVDAPIDKAALHRYGIYTWGLYAGETANNLEALQLYFDKAILRESAEALVDAILSQKR